MGDGEFTRPSHAPRLPPPGWQPDPAQTDLERFWDGTRWTGRTRDRYTRLESAPPAHLTYAPRTWTPEPTRRRFSLARVLSTTVIVFVLLAAGYHYANLSGQLPTWAEPGALAGYPNPAVPAGQVPGMQADASLVEPAAPAAPIDVDYPLFGSTELVRHLEAGMVAQQEAIDLTGMVTDYDDAALGDALLEAASQNPYLYVRGWQTRQLGQSVSVHPDYVYDATEAERRRSATYTAAADALVASGASAAAGTAEAVARIHDYIVQHATYDMGVFEAIEAGEESPRVAQSQEAYGILVMGTAVCNGYAMAFTAMAEQAGLESVVITGSDSGGVTGGSHAWNKVLVDGEWLLVDTTWDDPVGVPDFADVEIRRDYLLVPDGDPILSTRTTGTDWIVDQNLGAYGA